MLRKILRVEYPLYTPVIPRQLKRQRTTNVIEINKQSEGNNICLGTTCHGSVRSVAGCPQTGIYTIFSPVDFICFVVVSHVGCLGEDRFCFIVSTVGSLETE